jgi:hypothetical protein
MIAVHIRFPEVKQLSQYPAVGLMAELLHMPEPSSWEKRLTTAGQQKLAT